MASGWEGLAWFCIGVIAGFILSNPDKYFD